MSEMTTVEILTAARALISDPSHWTRGTYARNAVGSAVYPWAPEATCWCLNGAIGRMTGRVGVQHPAREPVKRALPAGYHNVICDFNDDPSVTHADVLAALDRAIAAEGERVVSTHCLLDGGDTPAHRLAQAMSDISEDCVCAGWETGQEFAFWELATREPLTEIEYGMSSISEGELRELLGLSEKAGGWVRWVDGKDYFDSGVQFVPMVEWLEIYAEHQKKGTMP